MKLIFSAVLSAIVASGCSRKGPQEEVICEAGATQICVCAPQVYGVQICDIDGDSWEPCDCSDSETGAGGGSGEGSGGGSGDTGLTDTGDAGEGSGGGSGEGSGGGSGEGSGSGSASIAPTTLTPWDARLNNGVNGWTVGKTSR